MALEVYALLSAMYSLTSRIFNENSDVKFVADRVKNGKKVYYNGSKLGKWWRRLEARQAEVTGHVPGRAGKGRTKPPNLNCS